MVTFPTADVIAACQQYGPQLNVTADLDGAKVAQAIASNESSLGANCGPRQEPAYSTGGPLATGTQAVWNQEYGDAVAAASHGPWQMMFGNFSTEAQQAIADGTVDLQTYAQEFVRWFNVYVIRLRSAQTLDEIGECWNLGHIGSDPAYTTKLEAAYNNA